MDSADVKPSLDNLEKFAAANWNIRGTGNPNIICQNVTLLRPSWTYYSAVDRKWLPYMYNGQRSFRYFGRCRDAKPNPSCQITPEKEPRRRPASILQTQ